MDSECMNCVTWHSAHISADLLNVPILHSWMHQRLPFMHGGLHVINQQNHIPNFIDMKVDLCLLYFSFFQACITIFNQVYSGHHVS